MRLPNPGSSVPRKERDEFDYDTSSSSSRLASLDETSWTNVWNGVLVERRIDPHGIRTTFVFDIGIRITVLQPTCGGRSTFCSEGYANSSTSMNDQPQSVHGGDCLIAEATDPLNQQMPSLPIPRLLQMALCDSTDFEKNSQNIYFSGRAMAESVIPKPANAQVPIVAKPEWDAQRRILTCTGFLIKRFRRAAPVQELVLIAFQESDWQTYVDDPLPPKAGCDPKQRLHDTIKCLNRDHQAAVIRFFGNGDGTAIGWEWRPQS